METAALYLHAFCVTVSKRWVLSGMALLGLYTFFCDINTGVKNYKMYMVSKMLIS